MTDAPSPEKWQRYRHPQPQHSPPELVIPDAMPTDERVWVPLEENVWFRPQEMITMFQVNGAMIYVDPDGKCVGYDDVFTRIERCRAHYAGNGLGVDAIERYIR
jgi:2,4'-dihydroxyacetophenone dioxygenase